MSNGSEPAQTPASPSTVFSASDSGTAQHVAQSPATVETAKQLEHAAKAQEETVLVFTSRKATASDLFPKQTSPSKTRREQASPSKASEDSVHTRTSTQGNARDETTGKKESVVKEEMLAALGCEPAVIAWFKQQAAGEAEAASVDQNAAETKKKTKKKSKVRKAGVVAEASVAVQAASEETNGHAGLVECRVDSKFDGLDKLADCTASQAQEEHADPEEVTLTLESSVATITPQQLNHKPQSTLSFVKRSITFAVRSVTSTRLMAYVAQSHAAQWTARMIVSVVCVVMWPLVKSGALVKGISVEEARRRVNDFVKELAGDAVMV